MAEYFIPEANIEKLRSKIKTIKNKCIKYGCKFEYRELGEEFREIEDDNKVKHTVKFFHVDVSGVARKDGWRFVATIDHRPDVGMNIINKYLTDVEVPVKYRTTSCICEHCNQKRARTHLYLVQNESTQEFMQVGSGCVKDLTDGLDGEYIASFLSWFQSVSDCEHFDTSGSFTHYFKLQTILAYAIECVKLFGYHKADSQYSTKSRVIDYYNYFERGMRFGMDFVERDLAGREFEALSDANKAEAYEMASWAKNLDNDVVDRNDYLYSLKVICSSEYCVYSDIGRLASLVVTYRREMDKKAEEERRKELQKKTADASTFVGQIKDKLHFIAKSLELVTSTSSQFGYSYLYKMIDAANNVYVWWSSNYIDLDALRLKELEFHRPIQYDITGTVKDHQEYNGVKQTLLTRCKVAAC